MILHNPPPPFLYGGISTTTQKSRGYLWGLS